MKSIVSAAILMIALMTGLAVPAYAETPPNNISTNVVDHSEKLNSATMNELVAQVQRETGYQFYVYFTDSFDGTSGSQWAYQAATNSHLDSSKVVLFAVAVKDKKYGSAFPSNSDLSKKASTMEGAAVPAMKDGKWDDAVEAYANQLIAISHKTDAESAQNSGQSDAAGGIFLTVITWIVSILAGLGLIVVAIMFGPRGVRNLIDYAHDLKTAKSEVKDLRVSVPAGISALDDSIVKAKDKLAYVVSMYGELPLISAKLHSAQTNMQAAIKKLANVPASAHGLRATNYRLRDLQNVLARVRSGEMNVSAAEKAMKDMETRVDSLKFGIAQAAKTVAKLKPQVVEGEETVALVRKRFDEGYLTNLVTALNLAMKNVTTAERNLAEAGSAVAANDFDRADELAKTADSNIANANQYFTDMSAIAREMARFSSKRDQIVQKFESEIAANTSENAHPSVQTLIPAAKAALVEASARQFDSGNPTKELEQVLAPATAYRDAVDHLMKLKGIVKEEKVRATTKIKAMRNWQKTALVSNIKEYGIAVTALEKVALGEVEKIMKVDIAGVEWDLKDVSPYDLSAATMLSKKLDYLNSTMQSLVASLTAKTETAIAAEERRQEEIRAEQERKRKEEKRKRDEEEAARRRRMSSSRSRSSSSSSSSYSSYGGGYSGGYDSSSSFSSSGGSFGGGFDSSGGSF